MRGPVTPLFIGLLLIGLCARQALSSEPLQLVTLDYPPYEYSENGEIKGLAVNVIREVFRRLDYKIEIISLPWARSLKLVERGQADAIFTAYRTPEREQFLDYSNEVLMPQEVSLFTRKSFPVHQSSELLSLGKYHFGARIGVSYGEKFDRAVENGTLENIHRVPDGDALIKLMLSSRVDIVPLALLRFVE